MEFVCSTFIKKFPGDPYLYQEVEGSRIEQEGELKQNQGVLSISISLVQKVFSASHHYCIFQIPLSLI